MFYQRNVFMKYVKYFIPSLWHFWEVLESLQGEAKQEEVRSLGCTLAFSLLSLSFFLACVCTFWPCVDQAYCTICSHYNGEQVALLQGQKNVVT
jgi:hypothetical protein